MSARMRPTIGRGGRGSLLRLPLTAETAPEWQREAEEEWEGPMAMNDREIFAQADKQVNALKERIARQHEAIKQESLEATPRRRPKQRNRR